MSLYTQTHTHTLGVISEQSQNVCDWKVLNIIFIKNYTQVSTTKSASITYSHQSECISWRLHCSDM